MTALTEEEKILCAIFKRRIQDIQILDEEDKSEKHLTLWLRARDLDVSKAEEMIRKSVDWRIQNRINDTLFDFRPPVVYKQLFRLTITGLDPEGCPIVIAPFWDIRPVATSQRDTFIRFVDKIIYQIAMDCKARGVTQFVFIADLEGFAWKHLKSRAAIEVLLQMIGNVEANYPEALKAAIAVNAPKIFTILFNLIKPLLTPRTLAKVQICGQNPEKWKQVLLEKVPANKLLVQYGGTLEEDRIQPIVRDVYSGSDSGLEDDFQGDLLRADEDEEEMNIIQIGAGEKFDVDLKVKSQGQILRWNFKCENNDVGFIVHFKPEGGSESIGDVAVPYSRLSSNEGSHEASGPGMYICTFDNTYSRFRNKLLHYSAQVLA